MTTEKSNINLNSILLMIVVGMSAWTLRTVFTQANENIAIQERLLVMDRDVIDIRARLLVAEKDIVAIRIQIAKDSK